MCIYPYVYIYIYITIYIYIYVYVYREIYGYMKYNTNDVYHDSIP